ncbi:FGGY family carbohydrate kinase [Halomonas elongata]|uniref:FGGY family carbohydrate kinase n=2 Tax=Halomonas elongata TaxID=2746 RepID=E1V9W8_HALED|nr:FGGY family carbohydrate kinase [Halomonas elongata]MBW5801952.1 glycerol kinase [Halomonas elongata]OBX34798.1 glycerol kinase [Halomonas elongata]WBF17596.1 glycerol kinase [Halomonas elongata]WPU46435.1 FGGY family carbohydrate kinase [Halomonas elongata DSM 2581]WVI71227.1 FGGY family carbohydrate kinase [Halomonas elongata]
MTTSTILAIDQGTTNSKAVLVDFGGNIIAKAQVGIPCQYPQPGWVEQSGEGIVQTVKEAIDACLSVSPDIEVAAVGISSQRESAIAWDSASGLPLAPCVSWQCRRSQPFCEELKRLGLNARVHELSGLPIDPLFSGSKFRWLLDSFDHSVSRHRVRLGNIDSWLLWNLTGGEVHLTDTSNASRTQLCDISSGQWSPELLDVFGIDSEMLPEIRPSSHMFGKTREFGSLKAGIPIMSMIGDSHAALFAQGGFRPGIVKATYGTGSSVMTTTQDQPIRAEGLATTVAWETPEQRVYALEGNITVSAAILPWTAKLLGLGGSVDRLAELAESADGEGQAILVPAMVGLGAPRWVGDITGLLDGLTFNTEPADVARAAFESIVFQIKDVVDVMRSAGQRHGLPPLTALKADGGASANGWLMQLQADTLGIMVQRAAQAELSAVGAALLAGLELGVWPTLEALEGVLSTFDTFEGLGVDQDIRHQAWIRSVERTLSQSKG